MNYKTLHFKTSTEYSLQYHNTQVQTKSKQQLQYNHGLGTGQRQNSRKVRTQKYKIQVPQRINLKNVVFQVQIK